MSSNRAPLPERAASYFSILRAASTDLNVISDELGKSIAEIDSALKKLNLGVSVWVPFRRDEGDGTPGHSWYWSEDLGYAKAGATWGICIRRIDGDHQLPEDAETEERWLFNDAPRRLRILAIDKIPELLENLSNEAARTTKEIRAKLADVEAIANVIKGRSTSAPPAVSENSWTSAPEQSLHDQPSPANLQAIRLAVCDVLTKSGHHSTSQLLLGAKWSSDSVGIRIEVPGMGKKMLSLAVNAAVERIIRTELQRFSVPARFIVAPGDVVPTGKEAK